MMADLAPGPASLRRTSHNSKRLGLSLPLPSTGRGPGCTAIELRICGPVESPEGMNLNSRGWNPRVEDRGTHDPEGVEESGAPRSCSTLSGSLAILKLCPVGLHPRLFTLLPSGESPAIGHLNLIQRQWGRDEGCEPRLACEMSL